MARKRNDAELIRGRAAHRRTEGDYMGVLVAAELADKVRAAEIIENPAVARLPDESGA